MQYLFQHSFITTLNISIAQMAMIELIAKLVIIKRII